MARLAFQVVMCVLFSGGGLLAMEEKLDPRVKIVTCFAKKKKSYWKPLGLKKKSVLREISNTDSSCVVVGTAAAAIICSNFCGLFNKEGTCEPQKWGITASTPLGDNNTFYIATSKGRIFSINLNSGQENQKEEVANIEGSKIVELLKSNTKNSLGVRFIPREQKKSRKRGRRKKSQRECKASLIDVSIKKTHHIETISAVCGIQFQTEGDVEYFVTYKTIELKGKKQIVANSWFINDQGSIQSNSAMTKQFDKRD